MKLSSWNQGQSQQLEAMNKMSGTDNENGDSNQRHASLPWRLIGVFAIICLLIGFVIGKEVSTTPQNEDVDGRIVVVEDNDGRPSHRDDTGDINEGRTSQNEDKRWTSPGNNDISSAPASRRSYMIGFYDLENLFDT